MINKRVIIVLNDLNNLKIIDKGLECASKDTSVEILYVYEQEHYFLEDLFWLNDTTIDKEEIKNKIEKYLKDNFNNFENVAILVYQEDTADRVEHLIRDDKDVKVIVQFHKNITLDIIKKIKVPILIIKKGIQKYKKVAIILNSINEKCIKKVKNKYSNIQLLYNYQIVVDTPMVDPSFGVVDYQQSVELEKIEKDNFNKLKNKFNLDGEFFVNGMSDISISDYINNYDYDLIIICQKIDDIFTINPLIEDIINSVNCDISTFNN